jgi:hypothetical protein
MRMSDQNGNGPRVRTEGRQQELFNSITTNSVPNNVVVRAQYVGTRHRLELAARCPKCHRLHRHIKPGKKTAPCGQKYIVELRRSTKRRAV